MNFVRFVREVVPHMRANRWGRIIGIQSSSVKEPVANLDLSNGIRPGVAADGIDELLVGFDDATIQAHVAAGIPMGRLGDPIEVGQLVAFLASEQAGYITGAVFQIDGGIIRSNV